MKKMILFLVDCRYLHISRNTELLFDACVSSYSAAVEYTCRFASHKSFKFLLLRWWYFSCYKQALTKISCKGLLSSFTYWMICYSYFCDFNDEEGDI